jgi:predicted secreted Zn-dependent protease
MTDPTTLTTPELAAILDDLDAAIHRHWATLVAAQERQRAIVVELQVRSLRAMAEEQAVARNVAHKGDDQ